MKKNDIVLIISLALFSLVSFLILSIILNRSTISNGTATILYNDNPILKIHLIDGSYDVIDEKYIVHIDETKYLYTVEGTNGDVVIEYKDNRVRVIDEISPQNICQAQGWSSSPLTPITCLPNNVIIIIEAPKSDEDPDVITG
ncbi:MAG: NusG domain II-containing protein [Bacilli bacterium]|nr:NusG domain II-containing protein [Bacilli bacterium]